MFTFLMYFTILFKKKKTRINIFNNGIKIQRSKKQKFSLYIF